MYSIRKDATHDEPTENTRREFENGMPNLVNHTLQYANKKLADVRAKAYVEAIRYAHQG